MKESLAPILWRVSVIVDIYEFSFIPVTETSTMFYLSKPFLETKTRFGIRDSRYWITDSLSVELGFRISIVVRIPKPWIPESRSKTFPDSKVQIFLHRATLKHFLSFFYTTTKNTKNHLSIQGVTFLVISISRDTVAKKLLMWAFTTLPPIHMRW